ncbi:MAG: EAL domain-containing protein [Proteobacteria bacterium]|nr:EAL domain-containing protein [Pseudomonadota bacterium]
MKIVTRLLLMFLLLAVLPLAIFSYVNLQQYEASMRDETLERLAGLADKKVIQVKSYLMERQREVRIRARGPEVITAINQLPTLYLAGTRHAGYLRAEADLHKYFARYIEETGLFYDVFLITPEGEIIYTQKHESDFASNLLGGTLRDSQLAHAFSTVRMTLEPVISGYESYQPSQMPALFIAAPIMDGGRFKGVFAAQLGNELLYRVATDATGLGASGEVTFAQRDGDDVLYTTPLKYRADTQMKFRFNAQAIKLTPTFEALAGNTGEGIKVDYRGVPVVAAWRYLPELAWGMAVKIDVVEEYGPVYAQRWRLLEMLCTVLLGVGLIAWYFGRQISVPLSALASTVDQMASGHLEQRVNESAPGELGAFARAFNRMTANLQASHASLEQRVEERTCELNQVNTDLQHNQELLNETQHLGKLGSWELNLVHGDLLWSDEIYRIFELDPDHFQPSYENFLNAIHPDDREKVNQAYTVSLQNQLPYDVTHRLLMADGRVKWVREHCSSEFDESGKPLRSFGAVQDISLQKFNEDNLRVAAVAFNTRDAIMITDANVNILRVNQAFEDITGYSLDEVTGKNPRILNSGRQDKVFYAQMWQQLLANGSWSGEIWDKRKNGDIYPKWMSITAVKDIVGQVSEYVAIFGDITARKRAEDEIRNLAFYDALTGLPNRRLLLDRIHLALSASARSHQSGALLFLDMDRFKTLNDTLGHDFGDMMLVEVGRRLQLCVRETDTVARLGGDEFVVLIDELGDHLEEASQKVALIAEKIRAQLAMPYLLQHHEIHSSPSIGVSLYRGAGNSVDGLMKQADMAMYQAKDAGRNAVRFFDPAMQQAVETHAQLEADLHRALQDQQLYLYYQIQMDGEQRAIGAEALIRWIHPIRGMVPPNHFIPVAEESALILEIGAWVIETACAQLAKWKKDELLCSLILAVNVSAHQFRQRDFVTKLEEVIARFAINPERLKLELTESVVLNDVAAVVTKMHALKALGVRLSLDDFGTGYSSLAYLKQLPLDQLKIDQSFVRDICTDPNDAVMVKTIIDMAKNFRLNVIAEGVETRAQLEFLQQNGCMAYQGYLFSKPVPIDQFERLVQEGNS